MKRIKQIVPIVFFTIVIFTACQSTKKNDVIGEIINNQLNTLLESENIDAVSFGLIKDGIVYEIHKGKLLNGATPNSKSTYEIASLTKTFTGTLLAQAIVDGKANLDDDIRKYLDGDFPNLEYEGQPILLRHLMTHQSGLPDMFPVVEGLFDNPDWDKLPFQINEIQEDFSEEQFMENLGKVKLDTLSGYTFQYSNAGANLVGYILENIYEKSYEELLKEYILAPNEMTQTSTRLAFFDKKDLVEGQNGSKVKMPFYTEKQMNAEGGIMSNVNDMLKYISFHMDTSNAVIKASHQELWDGQYGDFEAGLFWQINKDGDNPDKIFQNGGAFGTSSWVTIIPETQTGIFLVTNVSAQGIHQELSETVERILIEIENVSSGTSLK